MATLQEIITALVSRVPENKPVPKGFEPVVGIEDLEPETEPDTIGVAEGQSFIIEYVDGAGSFSRRPITVFDLVQSKTGYLSLRAKCHVRKKTRMFRIDRIRCCIDYDGEVHDDIPAFMHETFGTSMTGLVQPAPASLEVRPLGVRHEAVLFAALMRSDGSIHDLEIKRAVDFLSPSAAGAGVSVEEAERLLNKYLRRLLPTKSAIERALEHVRAMDPSAQMGFFSVCVAIVDADNRRAPEEIALINDMAEEILGVPVM
ncbi:MAG: TerB family tellurite resistance protein [Nitratireductor sp.]|nr:TerB family tellurite resistance protein [Nitratireductor sp.]